MSPCLQVVVHENRQPVKTEEFDRPVELGRQRDREETIYDRKREADQDRWVIARREETTVGRSQVTLFPMPDGRIRVRNGSDRRPIHFHDAPELPPSGECVLPLPFLIVLSPTKTIRVQRSNPLQTLPGATLPPRTGLGEKQSRLPTLVGPGDALTRADVLAWLSQAGELLQASAGGPGYFEIAARVVVDTVDLDAARVMRYGDGDWISTAVAGGDRVDVSYLRPPSGNVLDRVLTDKRTFWENPGNEADSSESLSGVETVVAAPILNGAGEVIGALYGERRDTMRPGQQQLGILEARLVELLARIVAGGLARVEEEQRAASANAMFEQFFTRELAQQLRACPGMLEGNDREVTILFCDIRGFSRISERLTAAQTIGWCRDVLDRLSSQVMAEAGVVVDYVGDGLMAMWGAPGEQPDHAQRACRAALAMLDELPGLNSLWEELLREPMRVGIGINSGTAQVGNVGSKHKFKYGAMGNAVNLASRVQGSSKNFKCQVLMTGETANRVGDGFLHRRLGDVRVVNITQPVQVHQLFPRGLAWAEEAKAEYEMALALFEEEKFGLAARALGDWRGQCPSDQPALVLLYRAVRAMVEGKPAGHPVWEFTEK